jgi:hypothetical protein
MKKSRFAQLLEFRLYILWFFLIIPKLKITVLTMNYNFFTLLYKIFISLIYVVNFAFVAADNTNLSNKYF